MNTSEGQLREEDVLNIWRGGIAYILDKRRRSYRPGGKRKRPQRRLTYVVKEDMQMVCVTEEDSRDWLKWRQMIYCDDP